MKKPLPKPKLEADEIDVLAKQLWTAGPHDFKLSDAVQHEERRIYPADKVKWMSRIMREFIQENYVAKGNK